MRSRARILVAAVDPEPTPSPEPSEPVSPPGESGLAAGEIDEAARLTIEAVRPYTMTGPLRVLALIEAVRYCVERGIPGALAECGVWRGGSVLAMLRTLVELGVADRDVYLYDTFEGMTEPTDADTSRFDPPAREQWRQENGRPYRALFDGESNGIDAVRTTLAASGYPLERVHLVAGPVERTLPQMAPESLALLRLDTDWYESTRHELEHLYPRLGSGGVLIIDDYGHWDGARRATDEYFAAAPVLLQRVDYTARLAIKV